LGERAEGPILLLCLTREEPTDAIVLRPLPAKQAEVLAGDIDPELRERVVETAGGNPLFVEQLVAFAKEGGSLDAVPPSVEALSGARLDRVGGGGRALLERAAVVGRLFSRNEVRELGGDVPRLVPLQEKSFVRRLRAGYRFHHVLVRDVAYASLPKGERAELHEQLADRLDPRRAPHHLAPHHP